MQNVKSFDDILNRESIFIDKKTLRRGYMPPSLEDVLHRDDIIKKYISCLKDALENEIPNNVFIFGKTGTGKTMLTELITNDLVKTAEKNNVKILVSYINCETNNTDTGVMKQLVGPLQKELDISDKKVSNSFSAYFHHYCDLINDFDGVPIIIFDEVDKLKNPDILNQFSRVQENRYTNKNICMLGITNDLFFVEQLNTRTKSALSQQEIDVPPYDASQLKDILNTRASMAFKEGALGNDVIILCSALAAQEHGDARKALDLLRVAGEIADSNGATTVTEENVYSAEKAIERDHVVDTISHLPTQTKLVILSSAKLFVENSKSRTKVTTPAVYDLYVKLCNKIDMRTLQRRRVADLIGELDMLGIISVDKAARGRYGIVNEIAINIPVETIFNTILEDMRFESLAEPTKESGQKTWF